MSTVVGVLRPVPVPEPDVLRRDPAAQAFMLLRIAFTVAPILFGLDKFTGWLVDWDKYIAPELTDLFNAHAHTLMYWVGVIEIAAGIGVAFKPKVFAYVVAAWLLLIVVNLLLIPGYFDVALRDFGLALGALALARLSQEFDR